MTVIICGIILIVLGIWGMVAYWWSFIESVRGFLPLVGVILGLICIGAGIRSSLKNETESALKK